MKQKTGTLLDATILPLSCLSDTGNFLQCFSFGGCGSCRLLASSPSPPNSRSLMSMLARASKLSQVSSSIGGGVATV